MYLNTFYCFNVNANVKCLREIKVFNNCYVSQ